jgi:hypothetical protein
MLEGGIRAKRKMLRVVALSHDFNFRSEYHFTIYLHFAKYCF